MWGPAIAAGANIVGGLINRDSARRASNMTRDMSLQQMQLQKDFAKSGIRWRVEDARKAGIHPLYALGANTTSYTPTSSTFAADTSLGNSFAAAGQDIGRAINSTRTTTERADATNKALSAIHLESAGVDLEIKKQMLQSAIAKNRDNATPPSPGWPIPEAKKWEDIPHLAFLGGKINTDKTTSNAEDFEKRWGEWGGDVTGLGVMGTDLWNTYRNKSTEPVPMRVARSIGAALEWLDRNVKPFHR